MVTREKYRVKVSYLGFSCLFCFKTDDLSIGLSAIGNRSIKTAKLMVQDRGKCDKQCVWVTQRTVSSA